MSDLNLTSFNPLYPMRVHQYDELFNDQNQGVPDKINSIIDYLNKVGKLTNDVVKDWNTVYQWVMNDGLTTDVNNKLEAMLANHEFDSIIDALATKVGDLNTLTTTAKDTIVNAINSLQTAVTANTTNIATNTANIATNTTNIASNTSALAQIATHQTDWVNVKNAPYNAKGDGTTNDSQAIQNAINDANTQGGGVVYLPKGTYIANIVLKSHVTLLGCGEETIIKLPNNSTTHGITLADNTTKFITLYNLTVDGNKANQTQTLSGIYLNNDRGSYTDSYYGLIDAYFRVENVKVLNCSGDGIYINTRGESFYTNVHSLNNNGNGIYANTFDTFFNNVSCGQNTNSGFRLYVSNCRFLSCKGWNNGINNTAMTDGYGFMITGAFNHFYVESQGNLLDGFYLYSSNNNIITVDVDTAGQNGSILTSGVSGVKVVNAYQNIINLSCNNRPDRSQTLILNAISLDINSIRNKIRGTFEYINTAISVDQVVMLKNDVSLHGRDGSSNAIAVVDTIGATSITSFSTFTAMPYGKVVAIGKDSFNTSILPAVLTGGVVVISNGSQGGRLTARYSGLDNNSNVVVYEGVWNNATSAMVWKLITATEGKYTTNGSGQTSVTIPHTLGVTPTYVHAQSGSTDAGTGTVNYVTADTTNITVYFKNALTTGTNNIVLYWRAKP